MMATFCRRAAVAALVALAASLLVPVGGAAPARADGPEKSKLLMVLDSSGSMKEPDRSGTTKIEAAKQALNTVVDKLPADAPVGLRVYGATVFDRSDPKACEDSQLVVPIGPADKPKLHAEIAKYKPYGETPISYSLRQAAKDVGTEGERSILLVSDGEETCDADPCAVAREIHEQGINLRIDVVGMSVGGKAEEQLRCIAEAGGGDFFNAQDADDLTARLEQTALRAFRPFTVTGTPVRGATEESSAVEIEAGQYTDELGGTKEENGRKFYRLSRQPASSIHVGFTAYPPQQEEMIGLNDAVHLALKTPDGDECAAYNGLQWSAGTRQILTDSVSFVPEQAEEDSPCTSAETLILQIERGAGTGAEGAGQESGTFPFEFLVIEEPPLADSDGLPEPVAEGSAPSQETSVEAGEPQGEVAGGGGFSQAATLRPGTWTDTVQDGEVLFYRVRADWGQTPRASFRVQPSKQAEQVLGAWYVNAHLEAFGPTRAALLRTDLASLVASRTTTMNSSLLPVRYRNREVELGLAASNSRGAASLAGYYYFALTVAESEDGNVQFPVQISVALDGEATGAPHYQADSAPTSDPGPTSSPTPESEPSPAATTGGGSGGNDTGGTATGRGQGTALMPVVIGGGLGLAVLACLVVFAGVLLQRSRRRQPPAGPPYPWPPHGPPGRR
jgi:Ca-activated chloride channel family protein